MSAGDSFSSASYLGIMTVEVASGSVSGASAGPAAVASTDCPEAAHCVSDFTAIAL